MLLKRKRLWVGVAILLLSFGSLPRSAKSLPPIMLRGDFLVGGEEDDKNKKAAEDKKKEEEKSKLKHLEEQLHKADKKERKDQRERDRSEGETEDSNSSFWSSVTSTLLSDFFLPLTAGVLIGFRGEGKALYGGDWRDCRFAEYPYARPDEGLFSRSGGKQASGRASISYFRNSPDLTGVDLRGRFAPVPFLYLEGACAGLSERLGSSTRSTQFYSLLVNYHRLRLPRWAIWWGLGFKGLHGERTHNGFAYDLGTEIFPARPVSAFLSYTGGWLEGRYLPEVLARVRLHARRMSPFVGYQRWSAGEAHIAGVTAGCEIYF